MSRKSQCFLQRQVKNDDDDDDDDGDDDEGLYFLTR